MTAHLKSEPVPEDQSEAAKTVVGLNFDEVVNDVTKDVLVVFHAPWCGHCKQFLPDFKKAAEKLKDENGIVLAMMDATANDVPKPYEVKGFPTTYFAAKNSKSNPQEYQVCLV